MSDKRLFSVVDHANSGYDLSSSSTLTLRPRSSTGKIPTISNGIITGHDLQTIYDNAPLQYGRERNIRVLQVAPKNIDGPIRCELSIISFYENTPYTAVSYEWGSDTDQRTILVGGEPFNVRQNVWQFLAQIRRGSPGTFLWIDAICIQQANICERNHQVAMMGDIYSNASKIIIWLGAEEILFHKRGLMETIRSATLDPNTYVRDNQLELRECMRQLAKNTYWTRAWVLQEFVLGAQIELRYGFGCLQEDVFRHFWTCTNRVRIEPANGLFGEEVARIHVMKRIIGYRFGRQKAPLPSLDPSGKRSRSRVSPQGYNLFSLEYLCEEFAQTQCSDPRDRIYSLLSLASPDLVQHTIAPDYGKTAADILAELVERYCNMYSVFRAYRKDTLGFTESARMTRSALGLELKRKTYNPANTMFRLKCEDLERYALLWAFMLEITDPERACRDAIRTAFYNVHQELLQAHSLPVPAVWYLEPSHTSIQQSDVLSTFEMDRELHSRGLLAFNTSKGFVDWIRTCSEGLWASGTLMETVRAGNIGRGGTMIARNQLSWLDDATDESEDENVASKSSTSN